MSAIRIAEDIIPLGDFKANASRLLRGLPTRTTPLIVTQNGRPAGVLLSPASYDRLMARDALLASIRKGLEDSEAGRGTPDSELDAFLDENFGPIPAP